MSELGFLGLEDDRIKKAEMKREDV